MLLYLFIIMFIFAGCFLFFGLLGIMLAFILTIVLSFSFGIEFFLTFLMLILSLILTCFLNSLFESLFEKKPNDDKKSNLNKNTIYQNVKKIYNLKHNTVIFRNGGVIMYVHFLPSDEIRKICLTDIKGVELYKKGNIELSIKKKDASYKKTSIQTENAIIIHEYINKTKPCFLHTILYEEEEFDKAKEIFMEAQKLVNILDGEVERQGF